MHIKKYSLKQAQKDLPVIQSHENKTRGGRCLIIAGSAGTWGAGILCAKAAARIGAGYVYIFDSRGCFPTSNKPDFLTVDNIKKFLEF